jgi:hypothetical protein
MKLLETMKLPEIGDIIAIPFFFWLIYYFYKKDKLTLEEHILFLFVIGGFIADIYFVLFYY